MDEVSACLAAPFVDCIVKIFMVLMLETKYTNRLKNNNTQYFKTGDGLSKKVYFFSLMKKYSNNQQECFKGRSNCTRNKLQLKKIVRKEQ
jgi:hypothetical protein